jgi:hypothetical protein
LQVADPQHQFGDGGGARVEFEAEELVRVDGEAFGFEQAWPWPMSCNWLSTSPSRRFMCSSVT